MEREKNPLNSPNFIMEANISGLPIKSIETVNDTYKQYQYGLIEGLEFALNLSHLPVEDWTAIVKGKMDEIESEL